MSLSAPSGPTKGSTRARRTTSGLAPTHVLAEPGDARTLCGQKRKDVLPLVWAPYVEMHVKGHNMEVCPGCAAAMEGKTYDPPGGIAGATAPSERDAAVPPLTLPLWG